MGDQYQVIAGNIGTVHEGNSQHVAQQKANEYVELSKANYGRVAGEDVAIHVTYPNGTTDLFFHYQGTFNFQD